MRHTIDTKDTADRQRFVPLVLLAAMLGFPGCSDQVGIASASEPDVQLQRARVRDDAFVRAHVWSEPATPISQFDFSANPAGGFAIAEEVSCRFVVQKLSGRTQKFHCQLPDGRIVKVKYGAENAELQAEVAGTRLLRALGFSADDMFVVRAVRCDGCPPFPFHSLKCNERLNLPGLCFGGPLAPDGEKTFAAAVIERRIQGTIVEGYEDQGWSWFELGRIDASKGGATRAELDAFRLMAMLLAHWDNKGPNQRLICPNGRQRADGGCAAPVAMIQDLGATFGPVRVDLPSWQATPIWRDRRTCTISMRTLPYAGATFPDVQISEAGPTHAAWLARTAVAIAVASALRRVTHDDVRPGGCRVPKSRRVGPCIRGKGSGNRRRGAVFRAVSIFNLRSARSSLAPPHRDALLVSLGYRIARPRTATIRIPFAFS